MFDIVVSGGFVVDGTGAPGRNADIERFKGNIYGY